MSHATDRMAETRWAGHGSAWPEGYRECTKCNEIKPTSEFHKHTRCKGGCANTLKNDATADELEKLLAFMRKGVCEIL